MTYSRDTADHINDLGTAHSADVQTSSTDTTADALMAVGAFGLGNTGTLFTPSNNLDDTGIPAGISYAFDTTTSGTKPFTYGTIINQRINANAGVQIATEVISSNSISTRLYSSGVFTAWQPVYTGANLNPNVFGGVASGDFLMAGVATSTTNALVYAPLSIVDSAPSSITTVSTFTVSNASGGVTYGTGLTPVLSGASGNSFLYLGVSGLSGLTVGQTVFLRQETASSKITVNY